MYVFTLTLTTVLSILLTSVHAQDSQECTQDRPVISAKGIVRGEDMPVIPTMKMYKRRDTVYLVHGNILELFCTGRSNNLVMSRMDGMKKLEAKQLVEVLNATTVKLTDKPEKEISGYECLDVDTGCSNTVVVMVGDLPEVSNFCCISKNLDYLNCTWSTSGRFNKFTLSYVKDGRVIPICEGGQSSVKICLWHSTSISMYTPETKTFSFLMQTCGVGCVNQTFEVDHYSIVKPDSPGGFSLFSKTSHSATLNWFIPDKVLHYFLNELDHKLEYWFPGSESQRVNISLPPNRWMYGININLPCADKYYEVSLSIKPKMAIGEEYWSEPATITFYTDPEEETVKNPICDKEPGETLDNMLYEISKLTKTVHKEVLKLKQEIHLLKLKAIRIKSESHSKNNTVFDDDGY